MTLNVYYFLSILFVIGCVGFSVKPSPIYGGLSLIVSGALGCVIILGYGGSFLGLMVFLVFLGGMMVVFGYTTAMSMEQYPESWVSNVAVWSVMLFSLFMEGLLSYVWLNYDYVEVIVQFNNMGEWVIYDGEGGVGYLSEGPTGVGAIYSYNYWLMFVAGWSLFAGILITMQIIRGN
ncbi:NADH dehydrogenase subunit 6 (mitochondrion) [Heterocephalus glaber]|uniref:NADH-ubiquinone oxidoreductase chain 6 n=1 Tax=Heterocephalus glaber TaxID=10181 RepID=E9NPD8_HETGA|nr:NADH dehydrogenase subunit 6 [Heterocephalus glaber]ADU57108.1 NADH dehydrogenase subunit 6 [Heterocephalus glaber]